MDVGSGLDAGSGAEPPPPRRRFLHAWGPRPRVTALALAAYAVVAAAAIALATAVPGLFGLSGAAEGAGWATLLFGGGLLGLGLVILLLRRAAPGLRARSVYAIGLGGALAAPTIYVVAFLVAPDLAGQIREHWSAPVVVTVVRLVGDVAAFALLATVVTLPFTAPAGLAMSAVLWWAWRAPAAPRSPGPAAP
jgi:hypothetical protein